MKKKWKALLTGIAGAVLFFGMTLTVHANPSGSEDLPTFMVMTPTIVLNVRNAPGNDGAIVGQIKPGEEVVASHNMGGWFMIEYKGNAQFAYGKYLSYVKDENGTFDENHAGLYPGVDKNGVIMQPKKPEEPAKQEVEELDIMMKATVDVNMRKSPNGDIENVLMKGEDIHVTGNVQDKTWYRCEYSGQTVYIYDDYLIPEFPQTMKTTAPLNVRTAPNTYSDPVGVLKAGDKIKVSGEENGWFRFTYEKTGQICYAYSQYLTVTK